MIIYRPVQPTEDLVMKIFLACGILGAALLLGGGAARAQGVTPSIQSEDAGATTGLGDSHRFHSADAASQHCPGDVIVWSSGVQLSYVLPGTPDYGQGAKGFYACQMEADSAGFTHK
jgi:hypothetical protein